jgi:hypothetical protein
MKTPWIVCACLWALSLIVGCGPGRSDDVEFTIHHDGFAVVRRTDENHYDVFILRKETLGKEGLRHLLTAAENNLVDLAEKDGVISAGGSCQQASPMVASKLKADLTAACIPGGCAVPCKEWQGLVVDGVPKVIKSGTTKSEKPIVLKDGESAGCGCSCP